MDENIKAGAENINFELEKTDENEKNEIDAQI